MTTPSLPLSPVVLSSGTRPMLPSALPSQLSHDLDADQALYLRTRQMQALARTLIASTGMYTTSGGGEQLEAIRQREILAALTDMPLDGNLSEAGRDHQTEDLLNRQALAGGPLTAYETRLATEEYWELHEQTDTLLSLLGTTPSELISAVLADNLPPLHYTGCHWEVASATIAERTALTTSILDAVQPVVPGRYATDGELKETKAVAAFTLLEETTPLQTLAAIFWSLSPPSENGASSKSVEISRTDAPQHTRTPRSAEGELAGSINIRSAPNNVPRSYMSDTSQRQNTLAGELSQQNQEIQSLLDRQPSASGAVTRLLEKEWLGVQTSMDDIFLDKKNNTIRSLNGRVQLSSTGVEMLPEEIASEIKKFWETPDPVSGMTPGQQLEGIRTRTLRTRAELAVLDGKITSVDKDVIDRLLLNSEQEEHRVYSIHTKKIDGTAGTRVAGTFIIIPIEGTFVSSSNREESVSLRPDYTGAALLYTPDDGYMKVQIRSGEITPVTEHDEPLRISLKQSIPQSASREFTSSTPDFWSRQIIFSPVREGVARDSVQSDLNKQISDIKHSINSADGYVSLSTMVQNVDAQATLRTQLDLSRAVIIRNYRLFELDKPEWLKNANHIQRVGLAQLLSEAYQYKAALSQELGRIPPLKVFADEKIKESLKRVYPTADVDPKNTRVEITTKTFSGRLDEKTGKPEFTTSTHFVSLRDFVLQNKDAWESNFETRVLIKGHVETDRNASLIDTSGNRVTDSTGKPVVLNQQQLYAMATALDVGHQYTDFLEKRMAPDATSGEAKELRDRWKLANEAVMRSEAFLTRLNPEAMETFTWQSKENPYGDKRGLRYIDAVINYPNPKARPKVDDYVVVANHLILGSANSKGGGGQVINGVIVISTRQPGSSTLVLYTPDAPDGIAWRELDSIEALDKKLAAPEWKAYFSSRMSTSDQGEVDRILNSRKGSSGSSILRPIEGDLQDGMYKELVGFKIAHADHRSISNEEVKSMSIYNKVMFGIDVVDFLVDFIPGKTLLSVGGDLARRVINKAVDAAPVLTRRIAASGRQELEFGRVAINPLRNKFFNPPVNVNGKWGYPAGPISPPAGKNIGSMPEWHDKIRISSITPEQGVVGAGKDSILETVNLKKPIAAYELSEADQKIVNAYLDDVYSGLSENEHPSKLSARELFERMMNSQALSNNYQRVVDKLKLHNQLSDDVKELSKATKDIDADDLRSKLDSKDFPVGSKGFLDSLLTRFDGVVIGESHSDPAAKKLILSSSMKDVKNVYLEGFFGRYIQKDIDDYLRGGGMSKRLDNMISTLDNKYHSNSNKYFRAIFEFAKDKKLNIYGVESPLAISEVVKSAGGDRVHGYNAYASRFIMEQQEKTPGKFIMLTGMLHASNTSTSIGIAERTGAVSVGVTSSELNKISIHTDVKNIKTVFTRPNIHLEIPIVDLVHRSRALSASSG